MSDSGITAQMQSKINPVYNGGILCHYRENYSQEPVWP